MTEQAIPITVDADKVRLSCACTSVAPQENSSGDCFHSPAHSLAPFAPPIARGIISYERRSGPTPELIRQGVVISAECGADGVTMGHYDGASFTNLRAIKEGLALADVEMHGKKG